MIIHFLMPVSEASIVLKYKDVRVDERVESWNSSSMLLYACRTSISRHLKKKITLFFKRTISKRY
jgi:hypothetical protein